MNEMQEVVMRYLVSRSSAEHLLQSDLGLSSYEVQMAMDRAQHDSSSVCLSTGAKLAFAEGDGFVIYGYGQQGEDLALYRRYARDGAGEAQVTFDVALDGSVRATLDGHVVEASTRGFQPTAGETWIVLPIDRPQIGRLIVRLVRLVAAVDVNPVVDVPVPSAVPFKARHMALAELDSDVLTLALTGSAFALDRSFSRFCHLAYYSGDPMLARRKCKTAANRKVRRNLNRVLNYGDYRGVQRFGRPLATNRADTI